MWSILKWSGYIIVSAIGLSVITGLVLAVLAASAVIGSVAIVIFIVLFFAFSIKDHVENKPNR